MISKAIKEGMRRKNLRQVDVAKHMCVSTSSVHEWVKGTKTPSGETLVKLVNYLGIADLLFPMLERETQEERMDSYESKIEQMDRRLQIVELKLENQELRESNDSPQKKQQPQKPKYPDYQDHHTGSISVSQYDNVPLDELYRLAKVTDRTRRIMSSIPEKEQRKALIEQLQKDDDPVTKSRR